MCKMVKYDAEIKPPGGFRSVKSENLGEFTAKEK